MLCPRCDTENISVMAKSPVGDVWEMYLCETCFYSWRSTETPVVDPLFKLSVDQIPSLGVIPPVPPLDPDVEI